MKRHRVQTVKLCCDCRWHEVDQSQRLDVCQHPELSSIDLVRGAQWAESCAENRAMYDSELYEWYGLRAPSGCGPQGVRWEERVAPQITEESQARFEAQLKAQARQARESAPR